MMTSARARLGFALLSPLLLAACDKLGGGGAGAAASAQPEPPKATGATTAAAAPAGTAQPAKPSGPVGYPLGAVKTIPDNCSKPSVILATAPGTVGQDYNWPWTRQAMLANQQFRVVDGPPAGPMQVRFQAYDYSSAIAVVATCSDGATCNQLGAMYKAIVRSSAPQLFCGPVPGVSGEGRRIAMMDPGGPQASLPAKSDVIGQCARISACMIASDQSTPGNPGLECQKAPSNFKLTCASRYPCSEVLACIGK